MPMDTFHFMILFVHARKVLCMLDVGIAFQEGSLKDFFPPPHEAEDTGLGLTPV